jgi:hypothetical protein
MWMMSVLVCFAIAVGGHTVLNRSVLRGSFVVKYLAWGGVLGIALAGQMFWRHGVALETWAALLLYACVSEFYLFVCALVATSVSVSLLIALHERSLTRKEIDGVCSPATMVDDRFEWLVANRFLERQQSGYRLTNRGQLLVVVFGRLRRWLRLEGPVGSVNRAAGRRG